MIVNIVRLCDGFLSVGPTLPGGPVQYFNDISQRTFLIKSCLFNTQTLILDAVVVRITVSWPVVSILKGVPFTFYNGRYTVHMWSGKTVSWSSLFPFLAGLAYLVSFSSYKADVS